MIDWQHTIREEPIGAAARIIGSGEGIKMTPFVRMAFVVALMPMLSGCLTSQLGKIGANDDPIPPTVQPVSYTGAQIGGRVLSLQYDTTIDVDRYVRRGATRDFDVDLSTLSWRRGGWSAIDPGCAGSAWQALPESAARRAVPLVTRPSDSVKEVVAMHTLQAGGVPLLSVQNTGLDAWIVCGTGDAVGYARMPTPPEPEPGRRQAKYVVASLILLPFTLALDIVGGTFCVVFSLAYGTVACWPHGR